MPLTGLAKTCWQSSSLYRGVLYRFHLLHCKGALCKENEGTLSPWMKHTPGTEHRRVRRAAHPASCPQTHKGERVISSKVSPPGPWVKHLSTRGFKMPQFSPCLCTGWICRGHSGNVSGMGTWALQGSPQPVQEKGSVPTRFKQTLMQQP